MLHQTLTTSALALALLLSLPLEAPARTWTDSTGRHTIEGEFAKLADGNVEIRRADGKLVRIPLEKLSEADQQHVRTLTTPADESPFAAVNEPAVATSRSATPAADGDMLTVIVDGVGLTRDAALKDAFRAAVQQVVGTVVDAETMIKNDEIIEDSVLTYSDGFVKKWEQIPTSQEQSGGLFRIKIKAFVQRRSVIAKLTAAKVNVKKVDGSGLFAEAITQMDAEKSARALVHKAVKDFPLNCLKAEVVGKPELVEKNDSEATVRVKVRFSADLQAYDAFATRFQETLNGIGKQSGEFSLHGRALPHSRRAPGSPASFCTFEDSTNTSWWSGRKKAWAKMIPAFPERSGYLDGAFKDNKLVIAINVQRTRQFDRSEWRYFVVDSSARFPLASVAACVFSAKLSFVGQQGDLIATERFPACVTDNRKFDGDYHVSLIFAGVGSDSPEYDDFYYGYGNDGQTTGFFKPYFSLLSGDKGEVLYLVAPIFFKTYDPPCENYLPAIVLTRDISLSLDELRRVESIRCELTHDGSLPPEVSQKP